MNYMLPARLARPEPPPPPPLPPPLEIRSPLSLVAPRGPKQRFPKKELLVSKHRSEQQSESSLHASPQSAHPEETGGRSEGASVVGRFVGLGVGCLVESSTGAVVGDAGAFVGISS